MRITVRFLGITIGALLFLNGCISMNPAFSEPPRLDGIASQYKGDEEIAKHPDVVFFDDFEQWRRNGSVPPAGTWVVRKNNHSHTKVVAGQIAFNHSTAPGKGIVEIACWSDGGSEVGGPYFKLGNYDHAKEGLGDGYDELFVRYYIKFDENYRLNRNHGVNIGGRDVTIKDAAWAGMAGISDVSSRGYFFSGLEPAGIHGDNRIEFDIYSYNLDKRDPWGESFIPQRNAVIKVGTWHSVERHLKLNSVDPRSNDGNFDGIEEVWIDGKLTHRIEGIRYRRVPHLRITYLSLETFYNGLSHMYNRENPIKVYFDNIIIATQYIGPINPLTP